MQACRSRSTSVAQTETCCKHSSNARRLLKPALLPLKNVQEVMTDPVMCVDGHSYERTAVTAWLQTHDTSPKTNERLRAKTLLANYALRSVIEALRARGHC